MNPLSLFNTESIKYESDFSSHARGITAQEKYWPSRYAIYVALELSQERY